MAQVQFQTPDPEVINTLRALLDAAEAGKVTVFGGFAIGPFGWQEFVTGSGLADVEISALGAAEMLKQHIIFRITTGQSPE